jgi:hypothetical protein
MREDEKDEKVLVVLPLQSVEFRVKSINRQINWFFGEISKTQKTNDINLETTFRDLNFF